MTKVFITGANKGLGYETARQLVAAGHIEPPRTWARDSCSWTSSTTHRWRLRPKLSKLTAASTFSSTMPVSRCGSPATRCRPLQRRPGYGYPGVAYPASKTAINMVTVQYAKAFPGMRIDAVEPGFTKTDLNGNTGTLTVEQGAEIIVRMAQIGSDGPTGG